MTKQSVCENEICVMIDATDSCQLDCRYCYFTNKGRHSMDIRKVFASAKSIIVWSKEMHKKSSVRFHYMGGEPLLEWDKILDLNKLARDYCDSIDMSFAWSLTSNLIELDENKAELMLNEKASIHCSIDGPPSIHNKNRPYARTKFPSFDDVAKGIPLALQVNPNDTARVTVCPEDAHNLKYIADFLLSFGFKNVGLFPAEGTQNNIDWQEDDIESWGIGLEEACTFVKSAYPGQNAISTLINGIAAKEKKCHNYCGAGNGLWALDVEGRLHYCHRLTHEPHYSLGPGYKFEIDQIETFHSNKGLQPSIEVLPDQCKECSVMPYCNGGCWAANLMENGDSSSPIATSCMLRRASLSAIKNLTTESILGGTKMCVIGECIICAGHCYVTLCCDPCQTCNRCDRCDRCDSHDRR